MPAAQGLVRLPLLAALLAKSLHACMLPMRQVACGLAEFLLGLHVLHGKLQGAVCHGSKGFMGGTSCAGATPGWSSCRRTIQGSRTTARRTG